MRLRCRVCQKNPVEYNARYRAEPQPMELYITVKVCEECMKGWIGEVSFEPLNEGSHLRIL